MQFIDFGEIFVYLRAYLRLLDTPEYLMQNWEIFWLHFLLLSKHIWQLCFETFRNIFGGTGQERGYIILNHFSKNLYSSDFCVYCFILGKTTFFKGWSRCNNSFGWSFEWNWGIWLFFISRVLDNSRLLWSCFLDCYEWANFHWGISSKMFKLTCGWWAALALTNCNKVGSALFWKSSTIQR